MSVAAGSEPHALGEGGSEEAQGGSARRTGSIWTRRIEVEFQHGLATVLILEAGVAATLVVVAIFEMVNSARAVLAESTEQPLSPATERVVFQFHWFRAGEELLPILVLCALLVSAAIALVATARRGEEFGGPSRAFVIAACVAQPVILVATYGWFRLSPGRALFFPGLFWRWFGSLYPTWVESVLWLGAFLLVVGMTQAWVTVKAHRIAWSSRWAAASAVALVAMWWLPINAINSQMLAASPTFGFLSKQVVPTGWSAGGVGVSCIPSKGCLAAALQVLNNALGPAKITWSSAALRDGIWDLGMTVRDQAVPYGAASIACVTTSQCLAVGRGTPGLAGSFLTAPVILWRTTNTGASWSSVQLAAPAGDGDVALRCIAIRCFLIEGTVLLESNDAGRTWRVSLSLPPSSDRLIVSVDCSSAGSCVATGDNGHAAVVFASDDGGRSWVGERSPPGYAVLATVRCPGRTCYATGITRSRSRAVVLLETSDNGAAWRALGRIPGVAQPTGLECASSGWCLALGSTASGSAAVVTTDSGATWQKSGSFSKEGISVAQLSCATPEMCVVVGADNEGAVLSTSSDGGRHWVEQRYPRAPL